MVIHPIDLQTMYSQIDNVAKQVVHQQQGAALAESVQQTNFVRQNKEDAKKVQQMEEQNKLSNLNQDGSSHSSSNSSFAENKKKEDDSIPVKKKLTESYLGQHIDITR